MTPRTARRVLVKGARRTRLWPFDQLNVGEVWRDEMRPSQAHCARNSAYQFGKRCKPKRKFSVQRIAYPGKVIIYVERTK